MSKPTIASLQAEIDRLNERLAQADALNEAQAARLDKAVAAYKQDQATIAELREQLAKPQAPKAPARPAHKPGEFIEPPRYATFKGVQHRAYYGRTANAIGWKPV